MGFSHILKLFLSLFLGDFKSPNSCILNQYIGPMPNYLHHAFKTCHLLLPRHCALLMAPLQDDFLSEARRSFQYRSYDILSFLSFRKVIFILLNVK